jgi:hypothetical protein
MLPFGRFRRQGSTTLKDPNFTVNGYPEGFGSQDIMKRFNSAPDNHMQLYDAVVGPNAAKLVGEATV